jgi:hypothetical protein
MDTAILSPTKPSTSIEWIVIDGQMLVSENNVIREATPEELERACNLINEETVASVKIYCRNPTCPGNGGWIQRTRQDIAKTVYTCELCHRAMER